ncbi:hypothetical protein GCM10027580_17360 [Corynebacterium faecale]
MRDDFAKLWVSGVMITPGTITPDHPGPFPMTGMIGAIQSEVSQASELCPNSFQSRDVKWYLGEFNVIGHRSIPPGPTISLN